jgi:hypothetical protein
MAGYSHTPLAQKLGIKAGNNVLIAGAPAGYLRSLEPLPADVRIADRLTASVDVAHVFTTDRAALEKSLATFRRKLGPTAIVWVSWPKKSSGVPTQVTEDIVRRVALPMGFVDIKVCAIDDVWSGLKLVVRKALR